MTETIQKIPIEDDQLDKVSWELMETYEALSTVYYSANLLAVSESIAQAASITLNCCVESTESSGGVFFIPIDGKLKCLASFNAGETLQAVGLSCVDRFKEKPYYEDNPEEGLCAADGVALETSLYVPFTMEDDQIGLIYLFSTVPKEFSSIDVKQVQSLCCQGGLAIRCFMHLNELREKNKALQKTLDQLTEAQEQVVRSERLSALGQMSSMIVHDIKNPMGGVLGYAQLLETLADDVSPEEIKEYSGVIIKEMRRLSNMTEEIMEFSRGMESKLNLREVTSRNLVAAASSVIDSELTSHGMHFVWDQVDNEKVLQADSDKMERVFINLAVNARNAMDEGGTLTVTTHLTEDHVEISFKDSGKGIPTDLFESVFEPFVTRRGGSVKGLGLGLAVSRWIVDSHGGRIWIHATGDQGTDFRIELPIQQHSPLLDEGFPKY